MAPASAIFRQTTTLDLSDSPSTPWRSFGILHVLYYLAMVHCVGSTVRIDKECFLGSGNYGQVWKAVDETSGTVFACKASRASLRLKRPLLRYEARVLQLLQGHRCILELLGYRHVEHFEFLGLELMGKELKAMLQPEHAMKPATALRVG